MTVPKIETTTDMLAAVTAVAEKDLAPQVREIDGGHYPEEIMRAMGTAGAYGAHMTSEGLGQTIEAIATAGEYCTSTAFCMWCQNALGWYLKSSDNPAPMDAIGAGVASGAILGGTGLSNPMKTFFGIETMRLKAKRVDGGYTVKGALPWVSNVGEDGFFGIVFETQDATPKRIMAVASCAQAGVKTTLDHDFVAMGGTATRAIKFFDAFIPDEMILADPIDGYLQRIRPGFVLMQCGMALGMVRSCIKLIEQVDAPLGHVNKFLDDQASDLIEELGKLQAEIDALAETPYDLSMGYFRRVVSARLAGSELSLKAANAAMLHQGARGYIGRGTAQRRLREAYFIAIVTPAIKQLKKMLAELPAA